MKQRQGVNFLCVSCLWHIFSYPCPSNLKKSIIQDQLKGSGWEALSLQLVSINCAIWPSITLPKWLHLAVAEGLETKPQWESPPLSERVSFKVLKYLGLLFTVWIKGCLGETGSLFWQGENAADVPWILGQWTLATYPQQQNHSESSGVEERTAGQEVGHCHQDCQWGLFLGGTRISFPQCGWSTIPVETKVLAFSRACWERTQGSAMNSTTLHCWWRLPNPCSLCLKVLQ